MKMFTSQQFPLPFRVDTEATFDNYWGGVDELVVSQLMALAMNNGMQPDGNDNRHHWIYLAADRGRGISHLLQASCALSLATSDNALYLNLAELLEAYANSPEGVFDGFESYSLLCLDDVDCLQARPDWQEQLFYLLERVKAVGNCRLLIGAHCSAQQLDFSLADLKSRLLLASGFQLSVLNDEQKLQLLQFKAHRLGLIINDECSRFLLQRCSRELADLMAMLKVLDEQAMITQRKITIPWLKSVLDL